MTTATATINRPVFDSYKANYFYTKGHCATVLGIQTSAIDFIHPATDSEGKIIGAWVELKNWETEFVSVGQIGQVFTDKRKAKATVLTATQHIDSGSKFTVWSETSNSRYQVQVGRDRVTCECADYQGQATAFGKKATCKHAYAALNKIGCKSLAQYLDKFPKTQSIWRNGAGLEPKGDAEFTRFHGYA